MLPHPAQVQRDLDKLQGLCARLVLLAKAAGEAYVEAYDTSLSPRSGEPAVLGRGFHESDPTGQTATNGQLRQLRWRAGKASGSLHRALRNVEEALSFLEEGFQHLDNEEWARFVQKTLAARG